MPEKEDNERWEVQQAHLIMIRVYSQSSTSNQCIAPAPVLSHFMLGHAAKSLPSSLSISPHLSKLIQMPMLS